MVHRQKVSKLVKKQQQDIKALEDQLKALELEQKKQELADRVASKRFWTKHKNLRESTRSFKQGLNVLGKQLKKGVAESLKAPKMTKKERAEFEGRY